MRDAPVGPWSLTRPTAVDSPGTATCLNAAAGAQAAPRVPPCARSAARHFGHLWMARVHFVSVRPGRITCPHSYQETRTSSRRLTVVRPTSRSSLFSFRVLSPGPTLRAPGNVSRVFLNFIKLVNSYRTRERNGFGFRLRTLQTRLLNMFKIDFIFPIKSNTIPT